MYLKIHGCIVLHRGRSGGRGGPWEAAPFNFVKKKKASSAFVPMSSFL